jgi:hypothetical protein
MSFWLVFGLAMGTWAHGRGITNGQLITLISRLG